MVLSLGRAWCLCMPHGLQSLPGHFDELLLVPADPALVAYVWVVIEVPAAHQPEQLVCVVGAYASVACQPTYRPKHLIVTSAFGTEPEAFEDVFDVHVGFGEVLIAETIQEVTGQGEPEALDLLSQKQWKCWPGPFVLVEEIHPPVEIVGCGEL